MNDDLVTSAEQCAKILKFGHPHGISSKRKAGTKIRKAENEKIPHMIILVKLKAQSHYPFKKQPQLDGTCDLETCIGQISMKSEPRLCQKKRASDNSGKLLLKQIQCDGFAHVQESQ